MSFNTLTTTEVSAGKPTTTITFTKIKDNFDNHEQRIGALETGGTTTYPPIIMRVNGHYSVRGIMDNVLKTVCNFDLTITGVRLYIDVAGISATTQVDLKVSHLGGAYTSIFTTKPSVASAAGNDAVSTNAVLDPTKVNISSGDLIRLDVTGVQGFGIGFMVRIDYIKT
jgi:hypothetical protein